MEIDEKSPSEINSDLINLVVDVDILDSSKKRKLQADESALPLTKHFCLDQASVAHPCYRLDRFLGEVPETESGTVITRSSSGEYDSVGWSHTQYSTCDSKSGKTASDHSSSTSITGGSYSFKDSCYSIGSTSFTKKETGCYDFASSSRDHHSFEYYDKTQAAQDQNQLEFIRSEFGVEDLEQLQDAEIQDFPYSQDVNAGSLVLSSGRWSVSNQDAGEGTGKPTIDQEFEQYFSALMM